MGKKRNREGAQQAPRARRSVAARLLAAFLGLLMVGCVGVAAVAFAMPAELGVSLPPQAVGGLGTGGAFVSALLLMLVVSRTRRRVAEAEFSRPELISVPVSDVEEYAPLFSDQGEVPKEPEAPVFPMPAARVHGLASAPFPAGQTVAVAAVAEPAPPLPDEVSFAPVEVAAPPVPAPPVQPTPFAELAPEPDLEASDPLPEVEAPKARRRGRRESPVSLDVVSGAWFSGPSKRGRRA
ncbi:MAG: hypothetical protein ACRDH8_04845 [Actinomycetota bacterium]